MNNTTIPIQVRLRPDLQWSAYASDRPNLWIAKDPLYQEYYFFSSIEKAIAISLDGNHSVDEIVKKCSRIEASVQADFVVKLVRRLDQASLLLHRKWRPSNPNESTLSNRWLAAANSLIACRIPLLNPSRAISHLEPIGKILFGRWSLVVVFVALLGCILILTQRWSELSADLRALQSGMRGDRLLLAGVLLLTIKVMHEMGHALACRAVGADCREMGVFFFFGAPCMYCDVSDAWRIPNRWARMLVSAGGMITELMIAVVACAVWVASSVPWVQSVALQIALLCSVVTILFNANPLLRYDGYYILSDGLGIPNLADQSREAWSQFWRSYLFGLERTDSVLRQTALALFHVASTCYRWLLLAVLLWGVNQWLFQLRLGGFGAILTTLFAIVVLGNFWRGLKPIFFHRKELEPFRWFRVGFWATAFLLLVWIGGTWNFPHHLFGRGIIEPVEQAKLYARHSAFVTDVVADGSISEAGTVVVVTESPELDLERVRTRGERSVAQVRWLQASNRSVDDPLASKQLAELQNQVLAIEQRARKLDQESDQLQIRSQIEGIFSDPLLAPTRFDIAGRSLGQRLKLGSLAKDRPFVERGDTVAEIHLPIRWRVNAFVSELDIDKCKLGANVQVRLDQWPSITMAGRVVSISEESLVRTPKTLLGDTLFASTFAKKQNDSKPEQTTYSLNIEVDTKGIMPIANGLASVQIETPSRTLLGGWWEVLQRDWRFMWASRSATRSGSGPFLFADSMHCS